MENQEQIKSNKVSKGTAALAGLSLALGLGWTLSSGLKRTPEPIITSQNRVEMSLGYRGICRQIEVLRDDRALPLEHSDLGGGLARVAVTLEPGEHQLKIRFRGLVPGLEKEYQLPVTVDQTSPSLSASISQTGEKKLVTTEETIPLAGSTDSDTTLTLEGNPLTQDNGQFKTNVELKPGWNHLLLSAMDQAGNKTQERFSIFRDVDDPVIDWQTKPDEVFKKKQARLVIQFEDDGSVVGVSGKVDGKQPIKWYAKGNDKWVGLTPELYEGFHQVSVKAVDQSGRLVEGKRQVIIDSSEALGDSVIGLGARGEDVKLLNERLAEAGYLESKTISAVFDKNTEKALKKLQQAEGYDVTGRAEGKVLVALGPRIFINLSNFSLVLDRPGKKQRRWMIASGSWAHPTPVGKYIIKEKVPHPTWLPPKSDWAKDAKPIPPGPGNPLGTRWLGFNWGGVGIHGTNAPWSIGTASSHGCLRMVTNQVEELYELVEVGTPVVVLGGWEKDPALERYWPKKKPEAPKAETAKAEPKKAETAKAETENSETEKTEAKDEVAQLDG